ncbi:MAG TPA: response regulator [Polyangiaceae bacterium]
MGSPEQARAGTAAGRVLLVDDNPSLRRVFVRALSRSGFVVVEVANGAEAMTLVPEGDFDVVVSDVRMPDMDGVELLTHIRDHDADLPVLLMSGDPDLETAMKAVKFGAFEYLAKPVPLSGLEASVTKAIGLRRSRLRAKEALEARSGARRQGATTLVPAESYTGALLGGRYRVGALIGTGGMGAVYEAEREDLGHMKVAIKVMLSLGRGRDDLFTRFRREAEAVAAIDHPNIVRVLDFQALPGEPPFLVMERLHGAPLGVVLASEGAFSAERAAFVGAQVLAALSAAHQAHVVHRDLKPDNVFLTAMSGMADIVKLLDFGIAKMVGAGLDAKLTQTGTVMGTPAYMSPEQARGAEADPRSDLYAVGCLMYEALCGRPPYVGENYNALLFAVQQAAPVPLSGRCPALAPALVAVVERAMARDVNARFQSAGAMADALAPWLVPKSVPPRSASPLAFAPTVSTPVAKSKRRKRREH